MVDAERVAVSPAPVSEGAVSDEMTVTAMAKAASAFAAGRT